MKMKIKLNQLEVTAALHKFLIEQCVIHLDTQKDEITLIEFDADSITNNSNSNDIVTVTYSISLP